MLMLHLRPTARPMPVQVSVAFYFSDAPPTRVPALLRLTRQDLDIPAGATRYEVTSTFRTPVDLDIFTVQPHAHNLAKEVEAFALLPDGHRKPLLLVKDWDFNWQGVYRYSQPVFLPAGTTVTARWTFDNSDARTRGIPIDRRSPCGSDSARRMRWRSCGFKWYRARQPTGRS